MEQDNNRETVHDLLANGFTHSVGKTLWIAKSKTKAAFIY